MAHQLTTCTFCGVGCGIYLETDGSQIIGAYPSMSHPANQGRICVRGWNVGEVASSPDRLRHPLIRDGEGFRPASWEEALSLIATQLNRIRQVHGPDAIGFINSPRCSNEESYLLQKLARAVIGTNNVDHGMGAYRGHSNEVLLEALGVAAATCSIEDVHRADVIMVDGVDLGLQLPTIGGRVLRAKLAGATLIVVDPRRHRIAEHADIFLQIRPGTDLLLYGAIAKIIVDRGLADLTFVQAHTQGYERFLEAIRTYDVLWVADACGVAPELIERAAVAYGSPRAGVIMYSTGAETRGVETVQSIVNLALLTGDIGRRGAGIMPLAEQNNLQGCCDVGMIPHRLPGYAPVSDAESRARFERLWSVRLPAAPGLTTQGMLDAAAEGRVKALWIDRHDPTTVSSEAMVVQALERLEFVVVQHLFMTETGRHADVILPMVAFGEERGTFTSTERRIQIAEQVIDPPHGPVPGWQQIVRVANRLRARWTYASPSDVMDEIRQAVPFYEGAGYDNLVREYGRQWPVTSDRPLGTPILFEHDVPPRPFKFASIPRPALSGSCIVAGYPFALILGRSLYYWHQNVLVQHSETLRREYRVLQLDYPTGFVDMNLEDAGHLGIRDGAQIRLVTMKGTATTTARVTREVKRGMIFVPYFLHDVIEAIAGNGESHGGSVDLPICARVEKV
jgi:predicted molibdopterin-dependent oxidoreductase YjgC